jgi:hypothetical protein
MKKCLRCNRKFDSDLYLCPDCGDYLVSPLTDNGTLEGKLAVLHERIAYKVAPISSYLTFIMVTGFIGNFFLINLKVPATVSIWLTIAWLWCSLVCFTYHRYYPTKTELVGDRFQKMSIYVESRAMPLTRYNSIFSTIFFLFLAAITVLVLVS